MKPRHRGHVVFTHNPEPSWRAPPTCNGACPTVVEPTGWSPQWDDLGFHPDHKRTGRHVFDALYTNGGSADNDHLFPELSEAGGLEAWKSPELYFFALTRDQPMTHYFPLTQKLIETKANALAHHKSQYTGPPVDGLRWVSKQVGAAVGEHVELAEGFQGWF